MRLERERVGVRWKETDKPHPTWFSLDHLEICSNISLLEWLTKKFRRQKHATEN